MSKLCLADALLSLAPETLPADTAYQVPWINAVLETFHSSGKWKDTVLRWKGLTTSAAFVIYQDANDNYCITLPRHIQSILAGATGYGTEDPPCASNTPVRGPWWAFNSAGPGAGDRVGTTGLTDAGDGWTTFRDFTVDSYLRIKTEVVEATGSTLLFRGLDEDGLEIYTGAGAASYQGVNLDISTALTTTTTQQFSAAPTLIRKPVTRGPIRLYSVAVSDATETFIGEYAAGEKNPGYRRYQVAGCEDGTMTTVHAMVKRRHTPVVADADEIIPSNLSALELGLQGRRYDLNNDTKTALDFWTRAFSLLNSELGEYRGGAAMRMQMERGSGLASIPRI